MLTPTPEIHILRVYKGFTVHAFPHQPASSRSLQLNLSAWCPGSGARGKEEKSNFFRAAGMADGTQWIVHARGCLVLSSILSCNKQDATPFFALFQHLSEQEQETTRFCSEACALLVLWQYFQI